MAQNAVNGLWDRGPGPELHPEEVALLAHFAVLLHVDFPLAGHDAEDHADKLEVAAYFAPPLLISLLEEIENSLPLLLTESQPGMSTSLTE